LDGRNHSAVRSEPSAGNAVSSRLSLVTPARKPPWLKLSFGFSTGSPMVMRDSPERWP
jgi:hypothetical protein